MVEGDRPSQAKRSEVAFGETAVVNWNLYWFDLKALVASPVGHSDGKSSVHNDFLRKRWSSSQDDSV